MHAPAVAFRDALADGQPDARAGDVVGLVQPGEHAEHALLSRRVDADQTHADAGAGRVDQALAAHPRRPGANGGEIAELAGVAAPDGAEGGSLAPLLREGDAVGVARPRDFLVWHLPHYFPKVPTRPSSALRRGRFKLVKDWETGSAELYDVAADPGEAEDLAPNDPDRVAALEALLEGYLDAVGAQRATPRKGATGLSSAP